MNLRNFIGKQTSMKYEIVTRGRTRGREGEHTPEFPIRTSRTRRGNFREDEEENFDDQDGAAKLLERPEFKEGIVDADTETAMEAEPRRNIHEKLGYSLDNLNRKKRKGKEISVQAEK